MQSRVNKLIIVYIILICLVGVGLFIKKQIDNLPIIDEALFQEILESTDLSLTDPGPDLTPGEDGQVDFAPGEDEKADYWENYHQDKQDDKDNKDGKDGNSKGKSQEDIKDPVVQQIQKKISTGDKLRIMRIIKSNLSTEEIKYILSLAKDGFDRDEQREVRAILQKKIGGKEKAELKNILLEYLM